MRLLEEQSGGSEPPVRGLVEDPTSMFIVIWPLGYANLDAALRVIQ